MLPIFVSNAILCQSRISVVRLKNNTKSMLNKNVLSKRMNNEELERQIIEVNIGPQPLLSSYQTITGKIEQ